MTARERALAAVESRTTDWVPAGYEAHPDAAYWLIAKLGAADCEELPGDACGYAEDIPLANALAG